MRRECDYPEDKAPEGAAWGAGIGAIAGGLVALAAAPPGGIFVAGPLLGLLGGAITGGAGGSILGALIGLGIPDETARVYVERIHAGGVLVGVEAETDAEAETARRILTSTARQERPREEVVVTEHAIA